MVCSCSGSVGGNCGVEGARERVSARNERRKERVRKRMR